MSSTQQTRRDAFIDYWKDFDGFGWRQWLGYAAYLGGLALLVFVARKVDPDGRFLVESLFVATAYLVLVPYLIIRRVRTKFGCFVRCWQCGDWFGQDVSGAYRGPNPKFRGVIQTGHCSRCGARILSDV